MGLFSRKKAPPPDIYKYSFPENVRSRILQAFQHLVANRHAPRGNFESFLEDVEEKLAREYGELYLPAYRALHRSDRAIINHFFSCPDPLVIDFILTAFRSPHNTAKQQGVDEINRILREEAIGYEFTNYNERVVEKPDNVTPWGFGRPGRFIEIDYPEAIEKREEYAHDAIVRPCLTVLGNPIFGTANAEMLKAHEHIRKGDLLHARWVSQHRQGDTGAGRDGPTVRARRSRAPRLGAGPPVMTGPPAPAVPLAQGLRTHAQSA